VPSRQPFWLVAALGAVTALTGCGTEVDLTKQTFQRTTVPAVAPGTTSASGASTATDAAFTSARLRQVDACALLDKQTLSEVGAPAQSSLADFATCSNYMSDPAGNELNITLTLGEGLIEDPREADKNIGGLPAIEQELDDNSACFLTAVTETSPAKGIRVQVGGDAPDHCDVGRTVLKAVVTRIRESPPRYSTANGSLVEVDPCGLLGEQEVKAALGAGGRPSPANLHWCTWHADGADLWVWLRHGADPAAPVDQGVSKVDIGGMTAYQELETNSSAKCTIEWAHRRLASGMAEVASVSFTRFTPRDGEDVCAKVLPVAQAVVAKLPKT
jgi:Protein of unknown function (DUF3558)